jgi:hypothetical protein
MKAAQVPVLLSCLVLSSWPLSAGVCGGTRGRSAGMSREAAQCQGAVQQQCLGGKVLTTNFGKGGALLPSANTVLATLGLRT